MFDIGSIIYSRLDFPKYMKYKTGEICPTTGTYRWAGHADGSITCTVTHNEYTIPMYVGNKFPPTKHCEKAAYWELVR